MAEKIIKGFLRDCQLRDLTPMTIVNYQSNLRIFSSFLKSKHVRFVDVDYEILRDFLGYLKNDRHDSIKRISNYFSALSSFYDYLVLEGMMTGNPVPPVRKRYLRRYKKIAVQGTRRAISVEDMSLLIHSILDPKYKAVAILFAKTGVRRGELLRIDVDDIEWKDLSITLKPCAKRSNRKVFFDDECARVLRRWIERRNSLGIDDGNPALFISKKGTRLERSQITKKINMYAARVGIHNPRSKRLEDRFSPHYFRHWYTTWLLRNGMPREYVKELRGDSRKDAIDIYNHIDNEDLRIQYLSAIPKLGL